MALFFQGDLIDPICRIDASVGAPLNYGIGSASARRRGQ